MADLGASWAKLSKGKKAAVGVGGLVLTYVGYKWFKNRSASAAATTAVTSQATNPATTADTGTVAGTGYSGGGGGGGGGGQLSSTLSGIESALAALQPTSTANTVAPVGQSDNTTSAATGTAAIAAAPPNSAAFPTSGGYAPTAASPTFGYSTIFNNNGTTYYGLGNQTELAQAKAAGYTITNAAAAGVPGGTTKAQYAYKPK